MQQNYSFANLIEFLEYAGTHGLLKASTAQSYRVGCGKIESTLTPDELADVRKIDADVVFARFANANKVKVSPATLREYRRRLATSIDEFLKWRNDPAGYRPRGARKEPPKDEDSKKQPKGTTKKKDGPRRSPGAESRPSEQSVAFAAQATAPMLTMPYPLRSDLLAHVQVPRDLTSDEANRLAAFIKTLATDFEPTK